MKNTQRDAKSFFKHSVTVFLVLCMLLGCKTVAVADENHERIRLAEIILENDNIYLSSENNSVKHGGQDNAHAYQNIIDTAQGGVAQRSSYSEGDRTAPGGSVELSPNLLRAILDIEAKYGRVNISMLAGGVHTNRSRHYDGKAADITRIGGRSPSITTGREIFDYLTELGYDLWNVYGNGIYEDSGHYHLEVRGYDHVRMQYDLNGGIWNYPASSDFPVAEGGRGFRVTIPDCRPEMPGCTFVGWSYPTPITPSADPEKTKGKNVEIWTIGHEVDVNGNVTCYAVWKLNREYENWFLFKANGGSGNKSPVGLADGSELPNLKNTFTRSGYKFTGWKVQNADGKWLREIPPEYRVIPSRSMAWTDNEANALLLPENYTGSFSGWQNANGKNETQCIYTFYAQWERDPDSGDQYKTMHFDLNGGTGDFPDITVKRYETVMIPYTVPVRPGYEFYCWCCNRRIEPAERPKLDNDDGLFLPGREETLSGDATLYAVWRKSDELVRKELSLASYDLPDGIYAIKGVGSGRWLTSPSEREGVVFIGSDQAIPADTQRWRFTRNSDGCYTITNVSSNMALDVKGGSYASGAAVQLYDSNNSEAQRWYVIPDGSGNYELISKRSYYALDVVGGARGENTPVQQYEPNHTSAQLWQFVNTGKNRFVFDANGGVGTMADLWLEDNARIPELKNTFTRESHSFSGWKVQNPDGKWLSENMKWVNSEKKAYVFPDGYTGVFNEDWIYSGKTKQEYNTYTLVAQWEKLDYFSLCGEPVDTYLTVRLTRSGDYIKSLPYSSTTDVESKNQGGKLSEGDCLTATAIIRNSQKVYWYKVEKKGFFGKKTVGYLPGSICSPILPDDVISYSIPTLELMQGVDGDLVGSLSASYPIARLGVQFPGYALSVASLSQPATKLDLGQQIKLNQDLDLSKLPAGSGKYQLTVGVKMPTIVKDGWGIDMNSVVAPASPEEFSYKVKAATAYTYTFNANGGSGGPGKQAKIKNVPFVIPSTEPARSGYSFQGWSTDRSAVRAAYTKGSSLNMDRDLTLYAVWEKNNSGTLTPADYLARCTVTNTYLRLQVNATAVSAGGSIKTLPCSQDTNSQSRTVRALKSGEMLTATAVYRNTAGNYWYRVDADNGGSGYIYGGHANLAGIPEDTVRGKASVPENIAKGKRQTIEGTISAKNVEITTVKGDLVGGDGRRQSQTVTVNGSSLQLSASNINRYLSFSELPRGRGELQLIVGVKTPYTDGSSLYSQEWTATPETQYFNIVVSYKVSFDAMGGNDAPAAITKTDNESVRLPADKPARDGYDFLGWSRYGYTDAPEFQPGGLLNVNAPDENGLTLYAVWRMKDQQPLYYDANGGTGAPAQQTLTRGKPVTLSQTVPTWEGRKFLGWSKDQLATAASYQPGEQATFDTMTTLYAVWKDVRPTYAIVFNANGGTGAPTSTVARQGDSYQIPRVTPQRDGMFFKGWTIGSTDAAPYYLEDSQLTVTGPIIFCAQWREPSVFSVTYNANGGTGAPDFSFDLEGSDFRISSTAPTRANCRFLGWSTDRDAAAAQYQAGQTITLTQNLDLYAVWQPVNYYTIHYDANGGSNAPADQIVVKGEDATLSTAVPTRSGYDFMGWAENPTDTTGLSGGTWVSLSANATFYAVWQKAPTANLILPNEGRAWLIKNGSVQEVDYNTATTEGLRRIQVDVTLSSAAAGLIPAGDLQFRFFPFSASQIAVALPRSGTRSIVFYAADGSYDVDIWAANSVYTSLPQFYSLTISQDAALSLHLDCVTLNGNGGLILAGTNVADIAFVREWASVMALPGSGFWSGHTLLGWSADSTAVAPEYPLGTEYLPLSDGACFYAIWQEDTPPAEDPGNEGG